MASVQTAAVQVSGLGLATTVTAACAACASNATATTACNRAHVHFIKTITQTSAAMSQLAVQEQELPDAWVHQLYAHVVPPAACGDLVLQFVNLLEALHALGSPPPPPAWLESLDEALTSHLTTISEGVCPWRHSTKSSSSRTGPAWPLTTVQCVLLLSLAAKHVREAGGAGGSSSEGAAQPLVFPLLCEAALLKAGQADGDAVLFDDSLPPHTPPEVEEALDEYHEVLRREMGPGRMLPPGLCRVKGPAACELQVPLLRRHRQRHLTAEVGSRAANTVLAALPLNLLHAHQMVAACAGLTSLNCCLWSWYGLWTNISACQPYRVVLV